MFILNIGNRKLYNVKLKLIEFGLKGKSSLFKGYFSIFFFASNIAKLKGLFNIFFNMKMIKLA